MKSIFLFFLLAICGNSFGQPPSSAIFSGGNADGWSSDVFRQPVVNIFNGGSGDGWAYDNIVQPADNIFNGGTGDGWANTPIVLLGITENQFGTALKAYPNPTSGQIEINLGQTYNNITIEITNISGQVIQQKACTPTDVIQINIDGSKGIYFIKLQAERQAAVIKVIKK